MSCLTVYSKDRTTTQSMNQNDDPAAVIPSAAIEHSTDYWVQLWNHYRAKSISEGQKGKTGVLEFEKRFPKEVRVSWLLCARSNLES